MSESGPRRADAAVPDRNFTELLQRQQNLLDDTMALVSLMSRSPREEWVSVHDLAREVWADQPTGEETLRLGHAERIRADRQWAGFLLESLFENMLTHARTDEIEVGVRDGRLVVADDGPGIPIEARDRVLESGFSSSPTGSGFGLSVVRHVAAALEWGIRIEERNDGGAQFVFTGVTVDHSSTVE